MNRRGFLKKGLLGAALLAIGGSAGLALYPTRRLATPTRALRALDDRGFQVLVAVAARVVPPGADAVAIAHGVDDALSCLPLDGQKDLRNLLALFESALPGMIFDGRAAPFTHLEAAAQDRVLIRWRDSRVALRRGAYHALRKLCLARYYADARTWPGIRYAGPPDTAGFLLDDSKAGTPAWIARQAVKAGDP